MVSWSRSGRGRLAPTLASNTGKVYPSVRLGWGCLCPSTPRTSVQCHHKAAVVKSELRMATEFASRLCRLPWARPEMEARVGCPCCFCPSRTTNKGRKHISSDGAEGHSWSTNPSVGPHHRLLRSSVDPADDDSTRYYTGLQAKNLHLSSTFDERVRTAT